jgi:hypothetical protein
MQERRRHGLCYNCDEPYVRGHQCPRLFYLESPDFLADDAVEDEGADDGAELALADAPAAALVVSLHALAGIRTENTMLLQVDVKGRRLLALLDTGLTHNFLHAGTMRRIGLTTSDSTNLRVTVANGDRLACEGMARHVPPALARRSSPLLASASTWAALTSSSASTTSGPWASFSGTSRPSPYRSGGATAASSGGAWVPPARPHHHRSSAPSPPILQQSLLDSLL